MNSPVWIVVWVVGGYLGARSTHDGGETVSTLSVEALEASRGLRGPVIKPEQPISAEDNFALAA